MPRSSWFAMVLCLVFGGRSWTAAAEWFVGPAGQSDAPGTRESPWDLASALSGRHKLAAGDTVWILGGTYKYPDRTLGSPGYTVKLAGQQDRPLHVRAARGQRVTIDGGLTIQPPSDWLWIRDLELLVSENATMSRTVADPGSHPESYGRPWGGLNIQAGQGCKYINLIIHDNAQGVSFWSGATDSELYGAIIYDNGWKAPDRGHGHAVYTQNKDGVKAIADCLMTGGYGYTLHAYGSKQAYVDNYLVEGNIAYDGGTFLIGGGRPSRNIRVRDNLLSNVSLQIGYTAKDNEDCEVRQNVILKGGLTIQNYKHAVQEGNVVCPPGSAQPSDVRIEIRPNRYDPDRAHAAFYSASDQPATVSWQPDKFLRRGDRCRLLDPKNVFGAPVREWTYDGQAVAVPVSKRFAAYVLLRDERR